MLNYHIATPLLAVLLLAVPAASGPDAALPQHPPANGQIHDRLARARTALLSGALRPVAAVAELKAILADDPRSAEGHLLLGMAYRMAGTPDLMGEAVAELRQALHLDPGFVPARFYLAHVYLDLGRPGRAREELEAALLAAPANPQFLALLGEAERQLGRPARAVELNREALDADASFAQARYYAGLALLDLDRRADAIRELELVVQSGPGLADPYHALGGALLDAGRLDRGLAVLRQGLAVDASRTDIRIQLARAYRLKRLPARAEEQLRLAAPAADAPAASIFFQQQVASDLDLEQGLLRLQQGRLQAAAEAFRRVLDTDPDHQAAARHLADVEKRLEALAEQKKPKTGGRP